MAKIIFLLMIIVEASAEVRCQADNEIQVYASPTIRHRWTIFELHSNYTFRGSNHLTEPASARWANQTLEITHGMGPDFEIGFYTFFAVAPGGGFQYLGNQVRPRATIPEKWNWNVGASLSVEFGYFRVTDTSGFNWQGEVRPIVDRNVGNWYFAFNPNIDFVLSGGNKGVGIAPQFKTVYSIVQKLGIGFEYYGGLGSFDRLLPLRLQEHLLGPALDLFVHPMWELNAGFLFGLTGISNQRVLKILLGRRVGR